MSETTSLYLGIDIGGTDVKIAVIDCQGQWIGETRVATRTLVTPDAIFKHAIKFARSLDDPDRLQAVGLAVPGVLDTTTSTLKEVVNLPGWLGVPLKRVLTDITGLPGSVVNDANSAAFAEHQLRGLDRESLALVTLGTGIGCGMVVAGRPIGGDHGCAGELGHICVDFTDAALPCTCGSRGHLETYAGAAGVLRRFRLAVADDDLKQINDVDLDQASPRDLAAAAGKGHLKSQQVIDKTAVYLGRAIGMLGQVADPQFVLLGGAMTFGGIDSPIGQRFLQSVQKTVKETTLVQVGENIKIEFATLGNRAGVLGAAMVAQKIA